MDWGHGLKSGAVAGILYGLMAGVVNAIYLLAAKERVISSIEAAIPSGVSIPISIEDLYNISLMASVPSSAFMGIFAGMAFGVIFLFMKDELMGRNSPMKGVLLAAILLAALVVIEALQPENAIGGFFLARFAFLPLAPVSAAAFLALGYIFGIFWDRFGRKDKKPKCK